MGTSITLTNIEDMPRKDVVDALEFIAKKIGYSEELLECDIPDDEPEQEDEPSPIKDIVETTSQAFGIEVDSQGLPWDGRIHASTRSKVADGTWKMRRGVDEEVVQVVRNELMATMGMEVKPLDIPSPLTPPPTQIFAQVPPPPLAEVPAAPFASAAVPPAPPITSLTTETPQAGTATTASPSELTFPKLMQKITAAFAAKTLDQAAIAGAVQSVGLPSLPMLASRPDLVPQVATALGLPL